MQGSCLCRAVVWDVSAPLEHAHACHCSICRKLHGTAYGAYALAAEDGFRFVSGQEQVRTYATSAANRRAFCGACGSVVPHGPAGSPIGIPLGGLDDPPPDLRLLAHIFVGSKAPWNEITDTLPQFDTWPPGIDLPVLPDQPRAEDDTISGSCICGGVAYQVARPPARMRHCHCSRCRKARSAPYATNAVFPPDELSFTRGEDRLTSFKLPDAKFFAQVFCKDCGAAMPRVDASRNLAIAPAGSLDTDPGVRPMEHIFVGSKVAWDEITDSLPQHMEAAPG
jgi:hypothetical protein